MGFFKFISFSLILIVVLLIYLVASTIQHEYIHQLIFQKYGIESNVTYNFVPSFKDELNNLFELPSSPLDDSEPLAWTTPITANSSILCNETCEMLHTQQEIVDSQTTTIVSMLFLILIVGFLYSEFFSSNTRNDDDIRKEVRKIIDEEYEVIEDRPRFEIYD